jgi:hypothetical protein
VIVAWLGTSSPALSAQALSRPTPAPDRTAAGSAWYLSREPIFVAGSYYLPAGASVFFDADTMVPIGRIDGVPLYADVTLEPHSIVFVPIGRGLLQPYERRRAGELAGTTGSRAPSFPVSLDGDSPRAPDPVFASSAADAPAAFDGLSASYADHEEATTGIAPSVSLAPGGVWTTLRPVGSRGIWIPYEDKVWVSAGPAERFEEASFIRTGTYAGFPVFRAADRGDVLFVPVVPGGLVTPYRRTDERPQ